MSKLRPRALPAAALLAAALALIAGPAAAAPTPTPAPAPTSTAPAPDGPAAPGDLRVGAITPTSVTLSWTPSTGDIAGYTVNYHQAFNDVYWSQPYGNVTTVTITGSILPTRQYSFSVYARDTAGGTSLATPWITVVTPAATTGDTTPPSAPTGLQITEVTADGPALSWAPSTDDTAVTGYQVYFFDGWYTSTLVGTATGTTFVAPFRSSGMPLPSYYVRARDAAGKLSIASGTVRAPPDRALDRRQHAADVGDAQRVGLHAGLTSSETSGSLRKLLTVPQRCTDTVGIPGIINLRRYTCCGRDEPGRRQLVWPAVSCRAS